jgi:chromosome segregation ATPase
MGKLVRVLVILFLVLSAGALALSTMLYMQKEVIKGRNIKLQKAVITLGQTIEKEIEKEQTSVGFSAKDISPVTSEEITNPELSDFWDDYELYLETLDAETLNLNNKRRELMSYYKLDPMGKPIKTVDYGEGTLQGVLDDLIEAASDQYDILNLTRQQLKEVRVELVDTIEELNRVKITGRRDKATIVELNRKNAELEAEIRRLQDKVSLLEDEKQTLEDEIAEKTRENATLLEEISQKNDEIADLKIKIEKELAKIEQRTASDAPVIDSELIANINSGEKGKIIAVNQEWEFIVAELDPDFVTQLVTLTPEGTIPALEVMIKDANGKFVAKARLTQLKVAKNTAIFDVLADWQTAPIQIGDSIFK